MHVTHPFTHHTTQPLPLSPHNARCREPSGRANVVQRIAVHTLRTQRTRATMAPGTHHARCEMPCAVQRQCSAAIHPSPTPREVPPGVLGPCRGSAAHDRAHAVQAWPQAHTTRGAKCRRAEAVQRVAVHTVRTQRTRATMAPGTHHARCQMPCAGQRQYSAF